MKTIKVFYCVIFFASIIALASCTTSSVKQSAPSKGGKLTPLGASHVTSFIVDRGVVYDTVTRPPGAILGVSVDPSGDVFFCESSGLLGKYNGGVVTSYYPTTQSLNGISFGDASTGIVVGNAGNILTTLNAGGTWTANLALTTAQNANAVKFLSTTTAVIVGVNTTLSTGFAMISTNQGSTWNSISLPPGTGSLNCIGSLPGNITQFWMMGASGLILNATLTGGVWSIVSSQSPSTANIKGCDFTTVSGVLRGIYVTDDGNAYQMSLGSTSDPPYSNSSAAPLTAVLMTDAMTNSNGDWICGFGIYQYSSGAWSQLADPGLSPTAQLYCIGTYNGSPIYFGSKAGLIYEWQQ